MFWKRQKNRDAEVETEILAMWRELPSEKRETIERRARLKGIAPPVGPAKAYSVFGLFFAGEIVGRLSSEAPFLFYAAPVIVIGIAVWDGLRERSEHEMRLALLSRTDE